MSATRYGRPFTPIDSSSPSFLAAASATSILYALQSTSINRFWDGPANRAIRIACSTADDYYLAMGSSLIKAESSNSVLMLGGSVETFYVQPSVQYVALGGSTSVDFVNISLGWGF